jgi:hypothetical protein
MSKYRKKPVIIEAVQVLPENINKLNALTNGGSRDATYYWEDGKLNHIVVKTLEGSMIANINDYLIKGISGELYPCKPDIFDKTYELVEN